MNDTFLGTSGSSKYPPEEPTTLERLQHFRIEQMPKLGDMYLAELISRAETELAEANATIERVRVLPEKWRDQVKRNKDTNSYGRHIAMNYISACANELDKALEKQE